MKTQNPPFSSRQSSFHLLASFYLAISPQHRKKLYTSKHHLEENYKNFQMKVWWKIWLVHIYCVFCIYWSSS